MPLPVGPYPSHHAIGPSAKQFAFVPWSGTSPLTAWLVLFQRVRSAFPSKCTARRNYFAPTQLLAKRWSVPLLQREDGVGIAGLGSERACGHAVRREPVGGLPEGHPGGTNQATV